MSNPPADFLEQLILPREAAELELLLASQMRTLPLVHRPHAHDVRSVLNAMQLSVELLSSLLETEADVAPGRFEVWQRHVDILREELGKLNRKLKGLLEPQEAMGVGRERFDVRHPVEELVELLRGTASRQRIALSVDVPAEAVIVEGDARRVRQALLNLLAYALNGMPYQGQLIIALERSPVRCIVRLEHTGPVLADEDRLRIETLQLPERDSATLSLLCAARLVAESHGGSLAIYSSQRHRECLDFSLRCSTNGTA